MEDNNRYQGPGSDYLGRNAFMRLRLTESDVTDPGISAVHGAYEAYREGFGKLMEAMASRDPTETEAAHLAKSKKAADRWFQRTAKAHDAALERANGALTATRLEMKDRLKLNETQHAGEIRSHIRSLDKSSRRELLEQAIESGDSDTLAAVLEGPAYLSGLNSEHQAMYRSKFAALHAGDLLKREQKLQESIELLNKTGDAADRAMGHLFDPNKVRDISQQSAKSKEAFDAI